MLTFLFLLVEIKGQDFCCGIGYYLLTKSISSTSFSLYPTDFAHFCVSSGEASNPSEEGSFKAFSIITSSEVYAAGLLPLSIDRSFRMLTGNEICLLEEAVNIFDYEWQDTHKSVKVHHPQYNQEYTFPIYTVVINE